MVTNLKVAATRSLSRTNPGPAHRLAKGSNDNVMTSKSKQGTSRAYTLKRLKDERPAFTSGPAVRPGGQLSRFLEGSDVLTLAPQICGVRGVSAAGEADNCFG
jgi:hypothetical protein